MSLQPIGRKPSTGVGGFPFKETNGNEAKESYAACSLHAALQIAMLRLDQKRISPTIGWESVAS